MAHGQEKYLTIQANTHIGTCSNCRRSVNVKAWEDHLCFIDEDHDFPPMEAPAPSLGDILKEALDNAEVTAYLKQNTITVEDRFTAKLYECVVFHYENGDRIGAEAILNAIQYAQQP